MYANMAAKRCKIKNDSKLSDDSAGNRGKAGPDRGYVLSVGEGRADHQAAAVVSFGLGEYREAASSLRRVLRSPLKLGQRTAVHFESVTGSQKIPAVPEG